MQMKLPVPLVGCDNPQDVLDMLRVHFPEQTNRWATESALRSIAVWYTQQFQPGVPLNLQYFTYEDFDKAPKDWDVEFPWTHGVIVGKLWKTT